MRHLATKISGIVALTVTAALTALSQKPDTPPAPKPEVVAPAIPTRDLDDKQLAAGLVKTNPLSLPSPPEFLYILSKQGSPKWRKLYHPVLQAQETDRTKTSLRLGMSIAEAHLATMARDAQKLRDVTNDLQGYAKVLGIRDGLTESARNINSLAESKSWPNVAFKLESLVTETSAILKEQRDGDLAELINTGLWVRLLQVSSSIVTEEDFPETSLAISSHWTLQRIVEPHLEAKSPALVSLRDQLLKISRLWAPEKKATGHKFDDALVEDTRNRLTNLMNLFTR